MTQDDGILGGMIPSDRLRLTGNQSIDGRALIIGGNPPEPARLAPGTIVSPAITSGGTIQIRSHGTVISGSTAIDYPAPDPAQQEAERNDVQQILDDLYTSGHRQSHLLAPFLMGTVRALRVLGHILDGQERTTRDRRQVADALCAAVHRIVG